jgi:hypothetical protein
MLRILLLVVISYIVIRIALRLLLTESPAARRARVRRQHTDQNPYERNASTNNTHTSKRRFQQAEDVEFEEISEKETRKRN